MKIGKVVALIKEIEHAMKDGLGVYKAAQYDVWMWDRYPNTALAYSSKKEEILVLILSVEDIRPITGDEYLDMAKEINNDIGAFVSPSRSIDGECLWAGKKQGPVHVYYFKVFNHPIK